jgi:hypothetical protein
MVRGVVVRHWGGIAMFFGVRGWQHSNKAKYIGNIKVGGSIQIGWEFIFFRFWGFWPVRS